MSTQSFFKLKIVALGLVLLLSLLVSASNAFGQEDSNGDAIKIGDSVEVDFGGKKEGTVVKFRGSLVVCEVEMHGRAIEMPLRPSQITLIGSGDSDGSAAEVAQLKMRSWTDASGSFSVKAKMLSNKNGKVELEKEDGRVITLPANKLSETDQAYLKEVAKAAAAEADEANPFAGGEKKGGRTKRGNASSKSSKSEATIVPEIGNSIVLSDSSWSVQPDPASETSSPNKIVNFASNMSKRYEFHNSTAAKLSPGKTMMGVSISNPFDKKTEVVGIDLASGKSTKPFNVGSKDAKLFAISGDGKIAVTFLKGRGADPGRMDFWTLSGDEAKNSLAWKTSGFHDRTGFAPRGGHFVAPSRLLTFGRQVVLWDCETAAALYSFGIPNGAQPAFSPGGNQMALVNNDSIFFVAVNDGSVLGSIEISEAPVQNLAFSENGRFLAGLNRATGEICVWDLTNQKVVRQFSAPGGSASSIQWCGNKYVLVNGSDLMDVELRASVWKYSTNGGSLVSGQDGRFWLVSKSKVTPVKLPHKDLDAKTAKFDPDELLILKPGVEVSIKLDTSFAPSEERSIRAKLTEALGSKNISVRDGAELQIVCTVKRQKQETVEVSSFFNPMGRRGGGEKITFTPNYATLNLEKNGEKLWGKGRRFGPGGIIHSNRDESTQQAANRLCKPNPSFFTGMKFPQYIGQLPSGPLGTSKITAQGVQ